VGEMAKTKNVEAVDPTFMCVACGRSMTVSQVAAVADVYVCTSIGECLEVIAGTLPIRGEHLPPTTMEAVRIRANKLAEATGRPQPDIGTPVKGEISWYWGAE